MAKLIYSMGEISGKVGGLVYSRNRWGPYVRELAIPTNPQTSYQMTARGRISTLSAAWRSLTAAQRLQWESYAVQIVRVDRFGNPITYNGYTAFVLLNTERFVVGLAQISTPPDLWSGDSPVSIVFTVAGTAMTLSTICIGGTCLADTGARLLCVESCAWQSAGAGYPKTWKTFGTFAKSTALPITLTTAYNARFGTIQAADGRRYFLRIYWVVAEDPPTAPSIGYVSSRASETVLSTVS